MTKEQFKSFWTARYSDTIPISHSFRHDHSDRWFRIHSLPESKRYADNGEEWKVLLDRQNTIMNEVLGEKSKVLIVTGDYYFEGHKEQYRIDDIDSINIF